MADERDLPAHVGQERMILHVLSNAGMVLFVRFSGLSVRVIGFAADFPTQVGIVSSTLERVSEPSRNSVCFELACSERNSALETL